MSLRRRRRRRQAELLMTCLSRREGRQRATRSRLKISQLKSLTTRRVKVLNCAVFKQTHTHTHHTTMMTTTTPEQLSHVKMSRGDHFYVRLILVSEAVIYDIRSLTSRCLVFVSSERAKSHLRVNDGSLVSRKIVAIVCCTLQHLSRKHQRHSSYNI